MSRELVAVVRSFSYCRSIDRLVGHDFNGRHQHLCSPILGCLLSSEALVVDCRSLNLSNFLCYFLLNLFSRLDSMAGVTILIMALSLHFKCWLVPSVSFYQSFLLNTRYLIIVESHTFNVRVLVVLSINSIRSHRDLLHLRSSIWYIFGLRLPSREGLLVLRLLRHLGFLGVHLGPSSRSCNSLS